MNRNELNTYAKMGATARLAEIQVEMAAITAAFPDLRQRAPNLKTELEASPAPAARKKYHMTPAARQAVAKRMKKYWADRRKTQITTETTAAATVGHRYPKKGRPRLINKEGRVVAQ